MELESCSLGIKYVNGILLISVLGRTAHLGHKFRMREEGPENLEIYNYFRGWIKDEEPTKEIEKWSWGRKKTKRELYRRCWGVEYYQNEENLNDAEKSSQIMLGKYPLEKQHGIPRWPKLEKLNWMVGVGLIMQWIE